MYLHRVTPTWNWDGHEEYLGKDSDDFRTEKSGVRGDRAWIVVAKFPRFGDGEKRQSDFEVGMRWEDVEKIIEHFCGVDHPEAIAYREGRKLVTVIEGLNRQPPHSN